MKQKRDSTSTEAIPKFIVRWLLQENEHRRKKTDNRTSAWKKLEQRTIDVFISFVALILLSPLFLIITLAKEIELIAGHTFYVSGSDTPSGKIFNWYEFIVLTLFSPILVIITLPFKIAAREEYVFSRTKKMGLGYRFFEEYNFKTEPTSPVTRHKQQNTRLGVFLIKTGLVKLPHLINVLKGDISLFRESHVTVLKSV